MLVLTRKQEQCVAVGETEGLGPVLKVTVLAIKGTSVKLGFEASENILVHRWEVWERIRAAGALARSPAGPVAHQTIPAAASRDVRGGGRGY